MGTERERVKLFPWSIRKFVSVLVKGLLIQAVIIMTIAPLSIIIIIQAITSFVLGTLEEPLITRKELMKAEVLFVLNSMDARV